MKNKVGVFTLTLLCTMLMSGNVLSDSIGGPGRVAGQKNPLKKVYFGEQHLHTRNSFDAFTVGVTQTWEDAYRFGRGEEVKLSTTGEKMKRRTPYDFVAITDHSEATASSKVWLTQRVRFPNQHLPSNSPR